MKKEWFFQLVALVIFYLDSIIFVDHEGISFSDEPGINLVFLLYSALLYLVVNYVLIPKYFYTKKYLLFFLSLLWTIIFFGGIEEEVIEKILSPNSRGANDLTWQSFYWYFGEKLVPLLTFMTIKLVFDNFNQQQQLEKIKQDRLNNELQLLKSQIQPHILFNSLNNLYHFALKKSAEVPGLILKLSNVLRYVLYETTDEKVALAKELAFIKDYIDLQEIQYEGRGEINFNLQLKQDSEAIIIAPFLLIPFIENSFKHSFGTKIREVFIEIDIVLQESSLHLAVKNNFEKDDGTNQELIQGGIGLKNVKKRLNLLYPNQHQLKIKETKQEYFITLDLKLP